MKILYIAQFHETCGYSHAAIGYLKALDEVISKAHNSSIDFKILSISLDPKKINKSYHNQKTSEKVLNLLDKYHFTSQEELQVFLSSDYKCIWHMTSILPVILKQPSVGVYYNNLQANIEKIIIGSMENYHILAWETDELCQEYKNCIKNYRPDRVAVPSEWNYETINRISNSIRIPHLVEKDDNCEISPVNIPMDIENKFVVLSISEWNKRKNFECLIKAFILEFHKNDDAVLIITVHSAKGTEAPICFVANAKQGTYPHVRSCGEIDAEEEERRILYVALTRAKNELFITKIN